MNPRKSFNPNRLNGPIHPRAPFRLAAGFAAALSAALPSLVPAAAAIQEAGDQLLEISQGIRITVETGGKIFLEVRPLPGDGFSHFALRYTDSLETWKEIRKWSDDPAPIVGRFYRIPLELLKPQFRYFALRKIFPGDRPSGSGWIHVVGEGQYPPGQESLWRIAEWFTGEGDRFRELSRANQVPDLIVRRGQEIRIPEKILLPLFSPTGRVGANGLLHFGRDEEGEFARYRLKVGEALYSAVVIQFTGRVDGDEVNRVATVIARRSGIQDVTRIPVDYMVKIPKELLTNQYLPAGDLDRIGNELRQAEIESVRISARSGNLKGVYVILDPGHGGIDVGTSYNGVRERDYVYDIMCRIKRKLEATTSAQVLTTVKDRKNGFAVSDSRKVRRNGDGAILTTPPYLHKDPNLRAVAVNLRWYLANSYYRALRKKGVSSEKILFTSLHADSLHPAVRGATFYVPGERYRRGTYGHKGKIYMRRKEVREQPTVRFSRSDRVRSEGLSRKFSSQLVRSFGRNSIAVHKFQPIRSHVIRRNRKWVPAVIRSNQIPTKLLLEVCNLRNRTDNKLLTDPAFRQRIADAYVEALIAYYKG